MKVINRFLFLVEPSPKSQNQTEKYKQGSRKGDRKMCSTKGAHFYHFEPVNLKSQSNVSNLIQEQTRNY